jgi:hypothetical protein
MRHCGFVESGDDRSDSYHELFARRFSDPPPLVSTPHERSGSVH